MSNKHEERIYKFHVDFEPIFGPDREIRDIREIELDIYAKTVNEAIATAWKTVTISPDEYRIIGATEDRVLGLTTNGVIYILNEQKPKEIANKLCDYLTKYKSIK